MEQLAAATKAEGPPGAEPEPAAAGAANGEAGTGVSQDPVIYFVRSRVTGGPPGQEQEEEAGHLQLGVVPVPASPSSSCDSSPRGDPKDPIAIERLNLMNMAKLSIKGLIESALNLGRSLDSDYAPLQQFFAVMEHCLKHGLKVKKTFLGQNKSFWGALEVVEKLCPEAGEITVSVKDLPGLKTPVGRGRAWLRLALMQKKLSDYMKALINRKDLLSEFYETNALMMEEEGAVIAGLLVGLNVIDVNLCMKGEDLDTQVGVIDFSLYLKDGAHSSKSAEGDGHITAILDQKNYVEELNRHLSATVNNLQAKVDALEKSNTKLTEELAVANNRIITLQEETERIKENAFYCDSTRKKMEVGKPDGNAEGLVPRPSRQGTDDVHTETRKQLKEETQLRLEVEKELEVQIGMKQEMELAMKMLEKDICDKQDVLVTFRQQLDDVQALNHELSQKLQGSDNVIRQKNEIITRLEEKANQMSCTIKQLERRLQQTQHNWHMAEEANHLFKQEFGEKIISLQNEVDWLSKQRSQLQMDLKEQRLGLHSDSVCDNNVEQLKRNLQQMANMQKELEQLREENRRLQKAGKDKPSNGTHQRRRSSTNTVTEAEKEPDWSVLEKQNTICKLCQEEASVTREKKRCSNCLTIVCSLCAIHELPLPSSIQPVCVCNPCHGALLQQYSTTLPT
ncbi:protein RUFY3 isoform X2 [Rhincodon typus]|uniref:protein RUFY3 isoform X2 n=1 Tax=Rhincodon typus TaxID=259920 RepID=UPI00202F7DCD|nr:protein RUFY3 isoform X2 [Rhincodon typus]